MKAPGIDEVHVEMLKAEEMLTPRLLTDILQTFLQTQTASNDWKIGLIVKRPIRPNKSYLVQTNSLLIRTNKLFVWTNLIRPNI